ncbi:uncharacterized protein LOC123507656 isoform X1 [Portunus trituberculatus]|uniref:uncharacterized protein LOC123507656 isoform X1 n=1 Tax=Portunus trituberculatus TaxID=210409 RepID=UPI001E1D2111|nr:uncharacterized protein LOC123507656 isoform X1 [Portunus trituberculatus]XP_045116672.1 uncharacterized protein LOC123507656 isoform X1 [Portunus trituberculatus]
MSKAQNRSSAGRPNHAPAKAEVIKLAAQGKDKMETRNVQDKTKDGMQAKNVTKDGKTTDKTMNGRQNKNGTQQETQHVLNKTEIQQSSQDSPVKGAAQHNGQGTPAQDSSQGKDAMLMNTKDTPGLKVILPTPTDVSGEVHVDQKLNSPQTKNPVVNNLQLKDAVLNNSQTKDDVSVGEVTEGEMKSMSNGPIEVNVNDLLKDSGLENESIKGDEGQWNQEKQNRKVTIQQNTIANCADITTGQQEKAESETSDKTAMEARETTITDVKSQTNQENQSANSETDLEQKIAVLEDKGDDGQRSESEGETRNLRLRSNIQNAPAPNRQRRNKTRHRQTSEDDSDNDSDDHLAMDNALVRHLLPHMSPALLPKAMQPLREARDSSSNSSDEEQQAQPKKLSLNVIKESSEASDAESDEEPMAPPPTALASMRRHSFHQFPAPPTKSQSKKAEKVRALLQAVEEEELEKISKKLGDKSNLVKQHLGHVENRLFEMFGDEEKRTININKFLMGLTATGMRPSDPRLKQTKQNLKKLQDQMGSEFVSLDIDYETFMGIISENLEIVVKAFSANFVIPDFQGFCKQMEEIYNKCYANHSGKPAQYIPQLARYDSKSWGMAICTVDGQRFSLGDVEVPFTIQSCSKPLTYATGLAVNGCDYMHNYVGMEPSGRYFNELVLDYSNKPHNPMINSGAIMTAAIIKPELSAADRFDYMFKVYKRLAGEEYLGFNNSVFLSERECADRNFALAYFMRENKCFPENHKLHESLDFYFQLCSLEITAESGAVMAATLANGGLNPLTGDPVLTVDAVRNTLTLMHSCGMYNYSGQFAFHVGLPAKSGVSGCVLLVIPNTMGICLWSPPLDTNGNSCRGVQFCMELVSRFNFHNFDNLRGFNLPKQDPRTAKIESKAQILFDLLFSAAAGDMSALRRHALAGTDMQSKDYDGRTALHVATSEGHDEIVSFLLNNCNVDPLPKDRWDRTPLDDAESFDHPKCARLITNCCKKKGIKLPISYKEYMEINKKQSGPLVTVNGI